MVSTYSIIPASSTLQNLHDDRQRLLPGRAFKVKALPKHNGVENDK